MEHKKLYKILIVIAIFLVGVALGCYTNRFINWSAGGKNIVNIKGGNTFSAGWQAAKEKLMSQGFFEVGEVNSLGGPIKEISGLKIIFSTNLLNPLDDESLKTRTALVNPNTKITLLKLMTKEEIAQAEKDRSDQLLELNKKLKAENDENQRNIIASQINILELKQIVYKEVAINLSQLKVGDNISVSASENIATKAEFLAQEVVITEEAPANAENSNVLLQ